MKITVEVTQSELDEMGLECGDILEMLPEEIDHGAMSISNFEYVGYNVEVNLIDEG